MAEMFLDWFLTSEHNPQQLYIMRGVPGSGKSFLAKTLAPAEQIFSTDSFFMVGGKYVFDPDKLHHYHNLCEGAVKKAMQRRLTPVVVDNTNILVRDFFPYVELAMQYGYKVAIKEPESPWWTTEIAPYLPEREKWPEQMKKAADILFEKNTHSVPYDKIERMLKRYHYPVSAEGMMKSILRRK